MQHTLWRFQFLLQLVPPALLITPLRPCLPRPVPSCSTCLPNHRLLSQSAQSTCPARFHSCPRPHLNKTNKVNLCLCLHLCNLRPTNRALNMTCHQPTTQSSTTLTHDQIFFFILLLELIQRLYVGVWVIKSSFLVVDKEKTSSSFGRNTRSVHHRWTVGSTASCTLLSWKPSANITWHDCAMFTACAPKQTSAGIFSICLQCNMHLH